MLTHQFQTPPKDAMHSERIEKEKKNIPFEVSITPALLWTSDTSAASADLVLVVPKALGLLGTTYERFCC